MADRRFPRTTKGVYYPTRQSYLNARAQARGAKSYAALRSRPTKMPALSLPTQQRETWRKAQRVFGRVLAGETFARAARAERMDPATALRYIAHKVERRGRRIAPRPEFSRGTRIWVTDARGRFPADIPSAADRSLYASYLNAVGQSGSGYGSGALQGFRDESIQEAGGERIRLVTDPHELRRLLDAGQFSFDELYLDM
jgi:hypothetical protein